MSSFWLRCRHPRCIYNHLFYFIFFPVAKIIPPHDSGIAGAILENLAPWEGVDVSEAAVRGKFCLKGGGWSQSREA